MIGEYQLFVVGAYFVIALTALIILIAIFYTGPYETKIRTLPRATSLPDEWKDFTLYDMHIRTSHNTYLDSFQNASRATYKSITDAMELGARCIELDVGLKNGSVVVGHGSGKTITTSTLPFDEALRTVRNHAFINIDDPLIILLELHERDNVALAQGIANAVNSTMGDIVWKRTDTPLSKTPIRDLSNKVIFISNCWLPEMSELIQIPGIIRNMGSQDPNRKFVQTPDRINRLFPSEWYTSLSFNIDAIPHMRNRFGMVAMNYGRFDSGLYHSLALFGSHAMVPFEKMSM